MYIHYKQFIAVQTLQFVGVESLEFIAVQSLRTLQGSTVIEDGPSNTVARVQSIRVTTDSSYQDIHCNS
jgi:hypothetical protein